MKADVSLNAPSLGPLFVLALGIAGLVGYAALNPDWAGGELSLLIATVAFVIVGALLRWKVPTNRLGWVVSLIGLALIAAAYAGTLADRGWLVGDAIGGTLWFGWFVLAGFLFLWFPTGHPPSPRWRFLEWLGIVLGAIALSYLLAGNLCLEAGDEGCLVWAANPIGFDFLPNPEYGPMSGFNLAFQALFMALSIAAMARRVITSKGIERVQLKWLLFAGVGLVGIILVEELLPELPAWLDNSLFGVAVAAIPIAIGIAILRYRLYDIERIISRTVGFVLVAAVIAAVYTFGAVWLPTRLVGEQTPIFVAASTLLAAALFNPIRRRVMTAVERRFHRRPYEAAKVVDSFSKQVRNEVDVSHVTGDLLSVVGETLRPASMGLWLRHR